MTTYPDELPALAGDSGSSPYYLDAIDARPILFTFEPNMLDGYGERGDEDGSWSYTEAERCEDCGAVIVNGDDHYWRAFTEDGSSVGWLPMDEAQSLGGDHEACPHEGEDSRDLYAEGPMMSVLWPCEIEDPDEAARVLVSLPLCPVSTPAGDGLALTGGGMDLSWEIAEAFLRLGQLPPSVLDLPAMAGYRLIPERAVIVACLRRSHELSEAWARSRAERLDRLVAQMAEVEAS